MNHDLRRIEVLRKDGQERFHEGASLAEFSLLDFWRWGHSDLLDNTSRGILAEFVVAKALGIATDGVRECWACWDLRTCEGLRIEVKSSAFVQSWHQRSLSKIDFGISKHSAWDGNTGHYSPTASRHADIYVFALLAHRNKQTIDPLDLRQWLFYALPTRVLDVQAPKRKRIGLTILEQLSGPGVQFAHLKELVERIAREHRLPVGR